MLESRTCFEQCNSHSHWAPSPPPSTHLLDGLQAGGGRRVQRQVVAAPAAVAGHRGLAGQAVELWVVEMPKCGEILHRGSSGDSGNGQGRQQQRQRISAGGRFAHREVVAGRRQATRTAGKQRAGRRQHACRVAVQLPAGVAHVGLDLLLGPCCAPDADLCMGGGCEGGGDGLQLLQCCVPDYPRANQRCSWSHPLPLSPPVPQWAPQAHMHIPSISP